MNLNYTRVNTRKKELWPVLRLVASQRNICYFIINLPKVISGKISRSFFCEVSLYFLAKSQLRLFYPKIAFTSQFTICWHCFIISRKKEYWLSAYLRYHQMFAEDNRLLRLFNYRFLIRFNEHF